jgi:membrane protease YdiL (CAAX protease family)
MTRPSRVPPPLTRGTVRAGHVLFLFALIWGAAAVFAVQLAGSTDADFRGLWIVLISHLLMAALLSALILAVPDLRKSLSFLYVRSRPPPSILDAMLFLGVMIAWAYGVHRLAVVYPVLRWRPDLMNAAGYFEHFPDVSAVHLALTFVVSGVLAPAIEELLFRGFLLNLLRVRWGLWPSVIVSSLAFGAIHFEWASYASVAGVFLALVYLKFGSLWPVTLLHGFYNVVASPLLLGPLLLEKDPAKLGSLSAWVPEIALSAAFLALLPVFWRRFRPAT